MKISTAFAALLFATCASAQIADRTSDRETARKFGVAVTAALNERDEKAMLQLLDIHGLALRAGKVQGLDGATLQRFTAGFEKGAAQMHAAYFQKLEISNGTAVFMRVTDTRPARALVRFDLGNDGTDYMEFVLETRDGRTRAVDWFQLSTGELLSVTAGGFGQMLTTTDTGLLARLFATDRVDASTLQYLKRAGELQRAGKFAEALIEVKKLPEPIRHARAMLIFQSSLALLSKNDAEYTAILAKLAERYADDPATAFMLIDHYFTKKDVSNMLKALDTMEKRVGIDGVTRNLRAAAYYSAGDYANTLKQADEAIRVEPTFMSGYDTRASALVGLGRYADAVAQYKDLEQRFDLQFSREAFTGDATFAKFVASPAFREWLPK